jgi:L-alanine-DL-glutamate epimerase-like enolase superfamily enzyme
MGLKLDYRVETHRLAAPFRISGYVFEASELVVVELSDGEHRGRGEAGGVYYLKDDAPRIVELLDSNRAAIEACGSREELRQMLPPGGSRNAVDCAMWELEANRSGIPAYRLAGIDAPRPLVTTFTLGADEPEVMAEGARNYTHAKAIKIKLTGSLELDVARVRAVREARPNVWIGVDANQGYAIRDLGALVDAMGQQRVALIEQPLPRGSEADLEGFESPIPIAADESVLGLDDVPGLVGRFQIVNIKLDKCGGLTEALMMAAEARRLGLGVMVGNMVGTSWAMAPAFILGQLCDVVDLDGPTFLKEDRVPGVEYRDGQIWCPDEVWGTPAAAAVLAA